MLLYSEGSHILKEQMLILNEVGVVGCLGFGGGFRVHILILDIDSGNIYAIR